MAAKSAKPAPAATGNRLQNADRQDSGIALRSKVSGRDRQRRPMWADAFHCLLGAVERRHAALAKANPFSPRIRPTLGWLAPKERGR
jgi:hypothetical protein